MNSRQAVLSKQPVAPTPRVRTARREPKSIRYTQDQIINIEPDGYCGWRAFFYGIHNRRATPQEARKLRHEIRLQCLCAHIALNINRYEEEAKKSKNDSLVALVRDFVDRDQEGRQQRTQEEIEKFIDDYIARNSADAQLNKWKKEQYQPIWMSDSEDLTMLHQKFQRNIILLYKNNRKFVLTGGKVLWQDSYATQPPLTLVLYRYATGGDLGAEVGNHFDYINLTPAQFETLGIPKTVASA